MEKLDYTMKKQSILKKNTLSIKKALLLKCEGAKIEGVFLLGIFKLGQKRSRVLKASVKI